MAWRAAARIDLNEAERNELEAQAQIILLSTVV